MLQKQIEKSWTINQQSGINQQFMTVIIKHYIIIIGTMKNNYLYNVMLKSKKKIIKIKFKNGKGNPRMFQNKKFNI